MNINEKIQIGKTLNSEFIDLFKKANINTQHYYYVSSSSDVSVSTVYGLANKSIKVTEKNIEAVLCLIRKCEEIFSFWEKTGLEGKSVLKSMGF